MSLEEIKEKKHSTGVYIVIGLLLVGMAGFGTSQFGLGGGSHNDSVITAGDASISKFEYDNALKGVRARNPNMNETQTAQLTIAALQQKAALADYIQQNPLSTDRAEIDQLISSNPNFFDNGQFSDEAFRREIGTSPSAYIKSLSADMAVQNIQQIIATTGVVSQSEIQPYLDVTGMKRDIFVAKVARALFADQTVSDEEIDQYYEAHKNDYMTDEKVSLSYIDLDPAAISSNIVINDADIEKAAMPDRSARYYVINNKENAQAIYEKAKQGQNLNDILAQMDKAVEDRGDLGRIAKVADSDLLIPQSSVDAIYALESEGNITEPMIIDGTVYIFELSDKGKTADITDAMLSSAKAKLQSKAAKPVIDELHEKLNKAVFETKSPDLNSIANDTGLTVKDMPLMPLNGDKDIENGNILAIPALLDAINNSDKAIGKLQDPVTIGERVIIYQITGIESPQQKTLDSVKADIRASLIAEKTEKQQTTAAEALVNQAKEKGLATAAQASNYPTSAFSDFTGQVKENEVLDPIGAILIAQQSPMLGDSNASMLMSPLGDAYVYTTTNVTLGNADDKAQAKKLNKSLALQIGQLELNQFLEAITQQADIKVQSSLLSQ